MVGAAAKGRTIFTRTRRRTRRSPSRSSSTPTPSATRSPAAMSIAADCSARAFIGRYFYGDLSGRVWSAALSQPSGQASNILEHTAALGGTSTLGNISSFGIDASGELYVVSISKGTVFRILNRSQPSQPVLAVDVPSNGSSRAQPFNLSGWAVDLGTASGVGTGVDAIRVQAFRAGAAPVTLTPPTYGYARPDVGAFFGSASSRTRAMGSWSPGSSRGSTSSSSRCTAP